MDFHWNKCTKPILALSPMADMTDSAFCRIVKTIASPIVFREMVSSEAIVRANGKTIEMAAIFETERPLIQQIFGADPNTMAEAARIIEETHKPEGIDINMGCPVYKLTSNFNGAALMKEPELASEIVRKIKAVIKVPLSVKMRAGWSQHTECIDFAKRMEDAGADLVSVHGRTKIQAYTGVANRGVVKRVKEAISIPVLYNGDIFTWEDYFVALEETKCDGALIGRGALGNPWIFSQIEQHLQNMPVEEVILKERIRVVREHFALHLLQYGEKAVPTFRKHLSWYFKGIPNFKQFKQPLMTASTRESVEDLLESLFTLDQTPNKD